MRHEPLEPWQLHAYVDGELAPDEVIGVERALAREPDAAAEVAALRAQKGALHARYDSVLDAPHRLSIGVHPARGASRPRRSWSWSGGWIGAALAAMLVLGFGIGIVTGWFARAQSDRDANPAIASTVGKPQSLDEFAREAAMSHAIFAPEVRHPVEVGADDEAHLVAWLSKRLDAPVVVPHLADAGWRLLGGRLLSADVGPVAQFMYQDARGRRLTLAVSHPRTSFDPVSTSRRPAGEFRIADEGGNTVFYWIDATYAYALTGKLARDEMNDLATRVYRELDKGIGR